MTDISYSRKFYWFFLRRPVTSSFKDIYVFYVQLLCALFRLPFITFLEISASLLLLEVIYPAVKVTICYLFRYELGGGAAQITSTEMVNDGKEHRLRIWRKGRNGTMVIDEGAPTEGSSSGILAMLNVEGDIFIGSMLALVDSASGMSCNQFIRNTKVFT